MNRKLRGPPIGLVLLARADWERRACTQNVVLDHSNAEPDVNDLIGCQFFSHHLGNQGERKTA